MVAARARASAATVIALILMLGAHAAGAAGIEEIRERGYPRVAIANEIPYGYVDSSGRARGVGPEVANAVFERMNLRNVQWVVTTFDSLIPGLLAERFDMVAAEMAILPERCRLVDFSHPNSSYGDGLLVPRGNPLGLRGYEDFADPEAGDLRIAIMAGSDDRSTLQALGVPAERMVVIRNNADAITVVRSGEADAYAATAQTARHLAAKSEHVQVVDDFRDPVINGRLLRAWGAFVFHPETPLLREAFNRELMDFRKTPEWRRILSRHGFTEADVRASRRYGTDELCQIDPH